MVPFADFHEVNGTICKGKTMKGNWNTEFQKNFGNENIESCKRFCKCKKECTGFNFNPKNGECSYKKDYPMNTYTNEAIEKTKQSCVIKGTINKKTCYLQYDFKR